MPADLMFLIALAALALAILGSWQAAKRAAEFTLTADAKAAGYALLSIIGGAVVVVILAASLSWGAI